MSLFDIIRYPISTLTPEEWERIPHEIRHKVNVRFGLMQHKYPRRDQYVRMVRKVIAEHNTEEDILDPAHELI